jgi:hypothetical protein
VKIDKEYLLTDSTVNSYGFRLLTSGYQMPEFAKNPIGYFMHGTPEFPREAGVLVSWTDLRLDGDKVYGKPDINMNHPRGTRSFDEVKNGFLNAASCGHFVVLEASEDPALMLPGQTGPTITKWFNRECSLVDIPGNFNALVLYDKEGNEINLSSFKAGKPVFTPPPAAAPAKEAKPAEKVPDARLQRLTAMSWDELDKADLLAELKSKDFPAFNKKFAEKFGKPAAAAVADEEAKKVDRKIHEQLRLAYIDHIITPEMLHTLKQSHKGKPDELAAVLEALAGQRVDELKAMPFDELDRKGLLEELKRKDLAAFRSKYKEAFGKEYTGK